MTNRRSFMRNASLTAFGLAFAKMVNAAGPGSKHILLRNGLMGKFMAFHNYRGRVLATYEGLKDNATEGRRPGSSYMPRFRNVFKQETNFLRGYSANVTAGRPLVNSHKGLGIELKQNLAKKTHANWNINAMMMGETQPKEKSRVYLDPTLKDKYGLPQLHVSVEYDDNDEKMLQDFFKEFSEMFEYAGYTNIKSVDTARKPDNENHEMGGIRMGKDPSTSLLNK